MSAVQHLLDELSSIGDYMQSWSGEEGDRVAVMEDLAIQVGAMLKSLKVQITFSHAAQIASRIRAAPFTDAQRHSLTVQLQNKVKTATAGNLESEGKQTFEQELCVMNALPQHIWDGLLERERPWEFKLQMLVDWFQLGGFVRGTEPARADIVAVAAACHWKHKIPDEKLLYEAVHKLKRYFDTTQRPADVTPLYVWPCSPGDLPRAIANALYARGLHVPCPIDPAMVRSVRRITSCRNNSRAARAWRPSHTGSSPSSAHSPVRAACDVPKPALLAPQANNDFSSGREHYPKLTESDLAHIARTQGWGEYPTVRVGVDVWGMDSTKLAQEFHSRQHAQELHSRTSPGDVHAQEFHSPEPPGDDHAQRVSHSTLHELQALRPARCERASGMSEALSADACRKLDEVVAVHTDVVTPAKTTSKEKKTLKVQKNPVATYTMRITGKPTCPRVHCRSRGTRRMLRVPDINLLPSGIARSCKLAEALILIPGNKK